MSQKSEDKQKYGITDGFTRDGVFLFNRGNTNGKIQSLPHSAGTMIPNCVCPDCHAQAFRTSEPGIAECGNCPGWWFRYKEDTGEALREAKIKIVNGQYQYVYEDDGKIEIKQK